MEIFFVCLGLAAIAALVYFFKFRKKDTSRKYIYDRLSDLGIDKRYAQFTTTVITPEGAELLSTVAVPQEYQVAYDSAIERMIANHSRAYPQFQVPQNVSDYPAILIDPMATNQENDPGSPALIVSGYQTAGTVIGTAVGSKLSPPRLVIPHQADRGWGYLSYFSHTVYNEGEHSAECRYDFATFMRYTGPDDVHPHVPDA